MISNDNPSNDYRDSKGSSNKMAQLKSHLRSSTNTKNKSADKQDKKIRGIHSNSKNNDTDQPKTEDNFGSSAKDRNFITDMFPRPDVGHPNTPQSPWSTKLLGRNGPNKSNSTHKEDRWVDMDSSKNEETKYFL
jgi:hypothetical protein